MHSLTPEYLAALRFDGAQAATLRTLGEYQGKQQLYAAQSPEALKGLRQIAVVESTRVVQPAGRCCRRALTAEVSGHPQRNAKEPLRTGDRRLP